MYLTDDRQRDRRDQSHVCAQRPLDAMAPHTAREKGLQLYGGSRGWQKGASTGGRREARIVLIAMLMVHLHQDAKLL